MWRQMLIRFVLLFFCSAPAVYSFTAIKSIDDYVSVGTERQYQYIAQDTLFGTLNVKFRGEEDFEGTPAYKFEANLDFDYTKIGNPVQLNISDNFYTDKQGYYVGNSMKAQVGLKKQTLFLEHQGDSLKGYFEASGVRQDRNMALSPMIRAVDNNMIYQMELFLSFHDFNVGDTITDSAFVPQVMTMAPMKLAVEDYRPVRYGDLVDSAYVLHMLAPQEQYVYYTPDHRIVKIDITGQQIQIILSEDVFEKMAPHEASGGFTDFIARLPIYLVYLFISILFALPFLKNNYKKVEIYFIFILGCAMFPLIASTQVPLQKWYSVKVLIPAMREGGSLYSYGLVSALIGGIIQETLKFIPILLAFLFRKPDRRTLIVYGIFSGLGFGFYEACSVTGAAFQTGVLGVFSWGVFERIFTMLFHTTSGALLGYGLGLGVLPLISAWLIASLLHTLENYTIIFYQKGQIDLGLFELMIAFINLIFLAVVWLITRRALSTKRRI